MSVKGAKQGAEIRLERQRGGSDCFGVCSGRGSWHAEDDGDCLRALVHTARPSSFERVPRSTPICMTEHTTHQALLRGRRGVPSPRSRLPEPAGLPLGGWMFMGGCMALLQQLLCLGLRVGPSHGVAVQQRFPRVRCCCLLVVCTLAARTSQGRPQHAAQALLRGNWGLQAGC